MPLGLRHCRAVQGALAVAGRILRVTLFLLSYPSRGREPGLEPGLFTLVEPGGFEPPTSCMPCKCATRLRQGPIDVTLDFSQLPLQQGGPARCLVMSQVGARRSMPRTGSPARHVTGHRDPV